MKKLLYFAAVAIVMLCGAACGNSKLSEEEARNHRLDDSLQVALANADTLFSLLYDVTSGMEQITQLEQLMNAPVNGGENAQGTRERIREQMEAIQRGLQERRARIAELEAQLAQADLGANAKLRKQVAQLRDQIDKQTAAVESLRSDLAAANIHIDALDATIDSLTIVADTISAARRVAEQQLAEAVDELNAVYFVIGTKTELRDHNIIEGGGFLRKTKVLPSDFDQSYMQRADRRTLTKLPLDSKKAKVLTSQDKDSYTITDNANGMKVLTITNPELFWKLTNILVVQVD